MAKANRTDRTPGTASGSPPEEGEAPGGRDSDRRRYAILRELWKRGTVTVEGLLADRNFRDKFRNDLKPPVLLQDFRELMKLVGLNTVITRPLPNTLKREHSTPSGPSGRPIEQHELKHLIGNKVATLLDKGEVIYLSTGTHVLECARALLDRNLQAARAVVTDNFMVYDLFRNRARATSDDGYDPDVLGVKLFILGGLVNFETGDTTQVVDQWQLGQWQLSTAVVSASALDPQSGRIFSFRQFEFKRKLFHELHVPKTIIPLLASKITKKTGGIAIFDPEKNPNRGSQEYHIVTTKLDPGVEASLKNHGYEVHYADAD